MELEELRRELDRGVLDQIAIADRSLAVADAIGSASACMGGFRGLLYHLLTTQADAFILALGRLFDPASSRYPTRSIPGFLDLLERNAETVQVYDRTPLEGFLSAQGARAEDPNEAPDLIREFIRAWRAFLLKPAGTSGGEPAAVLARIRARRDKQVAHNENWEPTDEERATWDDGRTVLASAKDFAMMIGPALLGMDYRDEDGTYSVTRSSGMIGTQAERMLELVRKALAAE